jgi:hypothetical protein
MKRRYQSQPRVTGEVRIPSVGCFPPGLSEVIKQLARENGRSRSWVIITLTAMATGYKLPLHLNAFTAPQTGSRRRLSESKVIRFRRVG